MISNQILQSTLDGLKEITDVGLYVLDTEGNRMASTEPSLPVTPEAVRSFAAQEEASAQIDGRLMFKVLDEGEPEYVLVTDGADSSCQVYGEMIVLQLQGLLTAYKEHFDRDNFIKNLLIDNLLLVDIHNRAKKLHIRSNMRRVVMIVTYRTGKTAGVQEMVRTSPVIGSEDFVTEVDADNVVVVKSLREQTDGKDAPEVKEAQDAARMIAQHLAREGIRDIHIAYGTVAGELREVSRSYKEAKMALEVGRIFSGDSTVIAYTELGIGRLIYQLPIPLCKMFIKEIFDNRRPDMFDEETLQTIEKFFENNLNVSETSRQLFIHRNTLVYRLDKLQKSTGLDLRVFEDAITFKIAMMVVKYMNHMEKSEY